MKLPRVFCPLDTPWLRLERQDEHHLRQVLRLQPGDRFVASDGQGREVLAELTPDRARVLQEHENRAEPPLHVWLLVALAKGERFERTLEKATELGVVRITPVLTRFGIVKAPGENRRERWLRLVREAAALAGRSRLPRLDPPWSLARALSEVDSRHRLLFSQGMPLAQSALTDSAAVLIGPEGGFSPEELEAARVQGWTTAGLGPRNLRVETAATVALTLVLARAGELGS